MSGGGYGNQGGGGMGNFANGGYGRSFGGFQGYGGQPQGYSQYQSGPQSFGGGNPWMRGGNKMGFQPYGGGNPYQGGMGYMPGGGWNNWPSQPQTDGDFQMTEGRSLAANLASQNGGMQVAPRNDMRAIPGESYASGTPAAPIGTPPAFTPQPSIGGPGQGGPSALPPGGSPGTSTLDYAKAGEVAKPGNIYGPNGAGDTSAQYNPMVQGWQAEYQAMMGKPAPFGRYADGSPREDPNQLNARAQAHQQWYGGGWGK